MSADTVRGKVESIRLSIVDRVDEGRADRQVNDVTQHAQTAERYHGNTGVPVHTACVPG